MLMIGLIGLAKSADIIHYLKEMMLAQNVEALGRSKMLQIIKLPLTILDILFPETIIKVIKPLYSNALYNSTTTQSIRHKEKI